MKNHKKIYFFFRGLSPWPLFVPIGGLLITSGLVLFIKNLNFIFFYKTKLISLIKQYFFKNMKFNLYFDMVVIKNKKNPFFKNLYIKKFYSYTTFTYKEIWISKGADNHPQIRILFTNEKEEDIIVSSNLTSQSSVRGQKTIFVGKKLYFKDKLKDKIYFVNHKKEFTISSDKKNWEKMMLDLEKANNESSLKIFDGDLSLQEIVKDCQYDALLRGFGKINYKEGFQSPKEMKEFLSKKGSLINDVIEPIIKIKD